jgi:hypothetical protein
MRIVDGRVPNLEIIALSTIERIWDPVQSTLQALITSITDATSDKVYEIIIPPGQGGLYSVVGSLTPKPWVNLKGAGGLNRKTVLSFTGGINIAYADLTSTFDRLTIEGIRFDNTVITFDISGGAVNALTVFMKDLYLPSHAYIRMAGNSFANRAKLNLDMERCWHQNNAAAQSAFIYCKLNVRDSEFHMFNFADADAVFSNCRLKSDQMCDVTGANWKSIVGGANAYSLVYHDCGEERYGGEAGVSLYHHAMAGWAGGGSIQVNGIIKGNGAPAGDVGLEGSARYEMGTVYLNTVNGDFWVKTAVVGTDTWTQLT